MGSMFRSAIGVAVLSLGIGAASLDDPIALRWKLAKGDSLRYRMTQEQTIEGELFGEIENHLAFVFRERVSDVAADGTAALDVRYEAMRIDNGGPMPMKYDSTLTGDAAKQNDPRVAKMVEPMLAAKLGMKLEPTGRVLELTGMNDMLEKAFPTAANPIPGDPTLVLKEMFNEDGLRRLVEVNVFPTEPIAAGHKWSRSVEQKVPMFGTLKLTFDYALIGFEERAATRCARIGVAGSMELVPEKESALPMKISIESPSISGTMFFAVSTGRLLESQVDTTMDMHIEGGGEGGPSFEMDMAIATVQRMALIAEDAPYFE